MLVLNNKANFQKKRQVELIAPKGKRQDKQ